MSCLGMLNSLLLLSGRCVGLSPRTAQPARSSSALAVLHRRISAAVCPHPSSQWWASPHIPGAAGATKSPQEHRSVKASDRRVLPRLGGSGPAGIASGEFDEGVAGRIGGQCCVGRRQACAGACAALNDAPGVAREALMHVGAMAIVRAFPTGSSHFPQPTLQIGPRAKRSRPTTAGRICERCVRAAIGKIARLRGRRAGEFSAHTNSVGLKWAPKARILTRISASDTCFEVGLRLSSVRPSRDP